MKRIWLWLCSAAILAAFFLHLAALRPTEEALCRAEALEYLLARGDPAVLETFAPYLEGEATPWPGSPDFDSGGERVGERMLCEDGRLDYIRPGSAEVIVFGD